MSVEILIKPTPSGDYDEYRFNARGSCSWILFRSPTEEDWVGVFGRADYGGNSAAVHWSGERAFVIANGQGYLINTTTRALVHRTDEDRLQDVTFVAARDAFVVADDLYLYVFDLNRLLWTTGRVSWDGIRKLTAVGSSVIGEAWSPGAWYNQGSWSKFTLDLDCKRVTGATYNGPDSDHGVDQCAIPRARR